MNYENKLFKVLESISRIKVTDGEGNTRVVYVGRDDTLKHGITDNLGRTSTNCSN